MRYIPVLVWLLAAHATAKAHAQAEQAPSAQLVRQPNEVVFDTVRERARNLALKPYSANSAHLPGELSALTYDAYRAIRFDPAQALWRNEALFEVQPFHPGFIFNAPVKINTVTRDGSIRSLPFTTDSFIYDEPAAQLRNKTFNGVGFSGFRVHYPMNSGDYKDEVMAFQGASYFRLLSIGQTFGISARGIAINTADANGEEFPHFIEHWLLTPRPGETEMYLFALLDSPSLSGALQFLLTPGLPTEVAVKVHLFARQDVGKLGVAPLTSMFLQGENSVQKFDDYRPEIHDSDGLLMHSETGEWVWRALANPPELRIVNLTSANVRGFGLMQRDDNFDHYQDLGAAYHTRPSLWVVPQGDWGAGRIELVEIPTPSETNDNIVAYWIPANPLKKGEEFTISYLLQSVSANFAAPELAKVIRTGNGWADLTGSKSNRAATERRFTVDFNGVAINQLAADMPLDADIQTSAGTVTDVSVNKLPGARGWRVSFQLASDKKEVADMRLYLTLRGKRISEVWNYVWSAKSLD